MKIRSFQYNVNDTPKKFYYDFELLASDLNCYMSDITFLGFGNSGRVYSTPQGNMVVINVDDFDIEASTGTFAYRKYTGSLEKLIIDENVIRDNLERDLYCKGKTQQQIFDELRRSHNEKTIQICRGKSEGKATSFNA